MHTGSVQIEQTVLNLYVRASIAIIRLGGTRFVPMHYRLYCRYCADVQQSLPYY